MRKIICDICKTEANPAQTTVTPWCGFAYTTVEVLSGQMKQETYDLCDKCSEMVVKFIRKQIDERQSIDNLTNYKTLGDSKGTCIKIRP